MGPHYLTVEQMRDRYPNQWLLVASPQTNDEDDLIAGEVIQQFQIQKTTPVTRPGVNSEAHSASPLKRTESGTIAAIPNSNGKFLELLQTLIVHPIIRHWFRLVGE